MIEAEARGSMQHRRASFEDMHFGRSGVRYCEEDPCAVGPPYPRVAVAFALATVSGVLASAAAAPGQNTLPTRDFGRPPSGEIPILFNDEHVYATPDVLRAGRVLAALVRNGVVMVPLRSMFEQLGATVSWDEATRTADVSKPGSDVKLTLGKPVIVV